MTNVDSKARAAFTAARAEQEKRVQAQPNYGPVFAYSVSSTPDLDERKTPCVKGGEPLNFFL
jgi:hypothetical protein